MLKKTLVFFLAIICLIVGYFINNKPVFANYSDRLEVYLNSRSSQAQIVSVTPSDYLYLKNVRGESFKCEREEFNLQNFLSEFSAKLIFSEELENGISYYAYSPKIKYQITLNGQKINLQIFIGKIVTVGSPMIFGSF